MEKSMERQTKREVKSMFIIFFDIINNSSWQARWSILHTTVMIYGDCVKMYENFTPNFGNKRTGCCITTMHHLIFHFSSEIFLTKNNMTVVPHPPYFSLIPQLKIKLKGHHFDIIEVIKAESREVLITLTEYNIQHKFLKWQKHWEQMTGRDYFEGEGGQYAQS
jgi:hypothetical protein